MGIAIKTFFLFGVGVIFCNLAFEKILATPTVNLKGNLKGKHKGKHKVLQKASKGKAFQKTFKAKKANHREPATDINYECSEFLRDGGPIGVRVGFGCNSQESLCIGYQYIERNFCEENKLVLHSCSKSGENIISIEVMDCPHGCDSSRGYGRCLSSS